MFSLFYYYLLGDAYVYWLISVAILAQAILAQAWLECFAIYTPSRTLGWRTRHRSYYHHLLSTAHRARNNRMNEGEAGRVRAAAALEPGSGNGKRARADGTQSDSDDDLEAALAKTRK